MSTTPKPVTAAQAVALEALLADAEAWAAKTGRSVIDAPYVEAKSLAVPVSGAALSALIKRGYVKTSPSISRMHGWDVAAYRLTAFGRSAARRIRTNATKEA